VIHIEHVAVVVKSGEARFETRTRQPHFCWRLLAIFFSSRSRSVLTRSWRLLPSPFQELF